MTDAVIEEYRTSLDDLTFNSKPHINALTMLAEEYLPHAEHIVRLVEAQLNKAQPVTKLPLMYLMDSVVKNVGGNYTPLFAKNLVKNFYGTFEAGDEKTKICLHKLRSTWDSYFPLRKLHELDMFVHSVDPNWPVKPLPTNLQEKPSTSIHVNPKFLKKAEGQTPPTNLGGSLSASKTAPPAVKDSVDLKQELINKQKELLELQQQKLLLELEQTKQQLALREKRNHVPKKPNDGVSRDPRMKIAAPAVQHKLKVTLTNGQTKLQTGATKDPRSLLAKQKGQHKALSVAVKKEASEDEQLRAKLLDAQKKSPKKSNGGKLTENTGTSKPSMQKSPTSAGKARLAKITSPKPLVAKSGPGKKTKGSKKKSDNVSSKKAAGETPSNSSKPTETKEPSGRKNLSDAQDGVKVKKRDRPTRRSPSHGSVPPAKQARRSTSTERPCVPTTPPKRRSNAPVPDVIEPAHSEEFHPRKPRDPRRIRERSPSPRFSPEPDELPRRARNWKPPAPAEAPWPSAEEPGFRPPLVRRRSSIDPNLRIPQELTLSHQAEILKQAEVQLQTGQLTHEQHQELLKQLHQLFELQRLRNTQIPDPGLPANHPPFEHDFVLHGNEEGRLLENRGHQGNVPSFQGDDHHGPVFRPPPSPPHMSADMSREDFSHGPPQKRPYGPRMDRPLGPHGPPPRDPPAVGHPNSRFADEHLDSRAPARDRRFDPRQGLRRRNGRGRIGRMQGVRRMGVKIRDTGPYVYDENEFPQGRPIAGEYRGGRESPVREEPFFSGRYGDRKPSDHSRPPTGDMPKQRKRPEKGESHHEHKKLALRVYASPEVPDRHGLCASMADMDKSEQRPTSPKLDQESKTEQTDHEDKAPLFEEPEDYIIASIPPEAEMYNKHIMSLNRRKSDADRAYTEHKKNLMRSAYTKQLASENECTDTGESSAPPAPSNDDASNTEESLGSPDALRKEKVEEDVNKSPSLPLKKRKYLVSASDFNAGDAQAESTDGMVTESEMEPTDQKKEEKSDEVLVTASEPSENSPQPDGGDVEMQPAEDAEEKIQEVEDNSEKALSEEVHSPEKSTEAQLVEVPDEEKATVDMDTDKELPKRKKGKAAKSAKKEQHPQNEGGDEEKEFDAKPEKRRELSKEKERKEKLRRRDWGKGIRRPRDDADMYDQQQEDRLRSLYIEEERRQEWEMELQRRLETPELEQDIDGRHIPDMGTGPHRRGRRGREGGPWDRRGRGRFLGRRGRGRDAWGRMKDDHGWDQEMAEPDMYPDVLPYPGRRPPPHDRLLPPPHERRAIMRERRQGGRGRPGPYRPHPDGRDRPWNEFDMDRPPLPVALRPGPPHERNPGPHPPYNPDDRMPGLAGRPGFPGRSPGREEPYVHTMQETQQPQPQAEMNQVNVNKLLQDLLTMGIIPGNKPVTGERPGSGPPSRNNSPAPAAVESVRKDVKRSATPPVGTAGLEAQAIAGDTRHVPTPVFHDEDLMKMDPDANIPEITFANMDKLKIRCDELISRLYTGIQCSACGMRFTARQTDVYAKHLDWHYRINRKDRDGIKDTHRNLYPTAGEWIMYEEVVDPSQSTNEQVFEESEGQAGDVPEPENPEDLVVPVKGLPNEDKCAVCHEAFKTVYNDEDDEWQYVNCVAVDDKNFHPSCYADHNDSSDLAPLPTPVRVPLYNPIESLKGIPGLDSLREKEGSGEEAELEKGHVTHEETTPMVKDDVAESEAPDAPAVAEDNTTGEVPSEQEKEADVGTDTASTGENDVEEEPGREMLVADSTEAPVAVEAKEEPVEQMEESLEETHSPSAIAETDISEPSGQESLPADDNSSAEVPKDPAKLEEEEEVQNKEESYPMDGIEVVELPSLPDVAASNADETEEQPEEEQKKDTVQVEQCAAESSAEAKDDETMKSDEEKETED